MEVFILIITETARLFLRTLKKDDIDDLMIIWGDEDVMIHCGGAGNREWEIKALEFYINLHMEKGYSPYAVILKENNELIGVCGFNPPHGDGHLELMYHFAKRYWGKGYATEAAKACINYAKVNLNIDIIAALIDKNNGESENVLRKLGFKYKGNEWHSISKKEEPCYELIL